MVAVSHHNFLHFFLGVTFFGDAFTPAMVPGLYQAGHANTGITIFEKPRARDLPGWVLTTWNRATSRPSPGWVRSTDLETTRRRPSVRALLALQRASFARPSATSIRSRPPTSGSGRPSGSTRSRRATQPVRSPAAFAPATSHQCAATSATSPAGARSARAPSGTGAGPA